MILMTTASIHGVEVERGHQIQHFDDVDLGVTCDTDKKNEGNVEHGKMCKLGLKCVDTDGEKKCEKQFDMVGVDSVCDTDEKRFVTDGVESGKMCNEGLECMDHDGHKMCMKPDFTEVDVGETCDTDKKNEAEIIEGIMCKLGLKCVDADGEGPNLEKKCEKQFDMVGVDEGCDTDEKSFVQDGVESGNMCNEGLECMDHDGHKMCMVPHQSSAPLANNYSFVALMAVALLSLLF